MSLQLQNLSYHPTPHKYKSTDRRVKKVELIVLHYTAVPYSTITDHGSNPRRIRNWLLGASRKSSTHYVVLRNGDVMQAADLDERTWHAGKSSIKTPTGKTLKSVNFCSIGIDFDNVGRLYPVKNGFVDSYGWSHYKKTGKIRYYKGPEPVEVDGTFWEPYSEEEIRSTQKVIYNILQENEHLIGEPWRLVGHSDVRSTKSDPGPTCPWERLREVFHPDFDPSSIDHY